ncbi:MAG: hypothetical protein JWO38_5973 [Gemmataceae bacterium]|nr:hypothetical protein [Gemmataceae bacterium]
MTDPIPGSPAPEFQKLLTELISRVADLEQQVAALKAGPGSFAASVPYTPPTEEELYDMLHGPRGQPLLEVIEEYEKKYLRSSP